MVHYNWWIYIDTLLPLKDHSLYQCWMSVVYIVWICTDVRWQVIIVIYDIEYFTALKILCSLPMASTDFCIIIRVLHFPKCQIVWITKYVAFSILSVGNIHLNFLHLIYGFIAHFLSLKWFYHLDPLYYLFTHSPTKGCFGCFQSFAITNKIAINNHG